MIEIVDNFLIEHNLTSPENCLLVGFSGGCDSLSLLNILHLLSQKYSFKVIALHLNHNWRGEESDIDEKNCRNFCEKFSIEYISEKLSNDSIKTELYARESRYDFFLKHAKKYPNSSIFTAHTKTDNAETVVYRMIKGTGIKGLQGILPKSIRDGHSIYRPLLNISREEIEGYCIANGLIANNDSSNLDINYKRNFIRHKLMPLFKEINYRAENSIVSLAKVAISHLAIVDEYMTLIKKDLFEDKKIVTAKFNTLSNSVKQKVLYDFISGEKIDHDFKKLSNILGFIKENINSKAGLKYSISKDLWLFVSSKYIYLISGFKNIQKINEIRISEEGVFDILGTNLEFSIEKFNLEPGTEFPRENADFAYINLDAISNLTIRNRKDGDFISPFGMEGKMKLKKYLNSKGVFQHDRDKLILLCRESEVLWVVGVGLSNKLKVGNKATHVIQLKNKKVMNDGV